MRAVVQRVSEASVSINHQQVAAIGSGLVVFLGIGQMDGQKEMLWMADKIVNLRIFSDEHGKMNCSLAQVDLAMLIVSQFTLYGDCRKGRRPGYAQAAPPAVAEPLYEGFVKKIKAYGIETATGTFQEMMQVNLVNDGPVTLLLDSEKRF